MPVDAGQLAQKVVFALDEAVVLGLPAADPGMAQPFADQPVEFQAEVVELVEKSHVLHVLLEAGA